MDVELPVLIERQPDYTTCGPKDHNSPPVRMKT